MKKILTIPNRFMLTLKPQLMSLPVLLFSVLTFAFPSYDVYGQATSETLDYTSISYNQVSKHLIIVFDEDIDRDSVDLSKFDIIASPMGGGVRNLAFPPQPATVDSVNGNTLTLQLAKFQYAVIDVALKNPDFPTPTLTIRSGAVTDADGEETVTPGTNQTITILGVTPPIITEFPCPTAINTLLVAGTGEEDHAIELFNDNDVSVGTATVDSDGDWEITVQLELSSVDVTHTFTAKATSNGVESPESAPKSRLVTGQSNSPPAPPTISSNIPYIRLQNVLYVNGSAERCDTIELFDRGMSVGTVIAHADSGNWEITVQLERSRDAVTHVFTATATNLAGNTSALSNEQSETVPGQPNRPPVSLVDPSSDSTIPDRFDPELEFSLKLNSAPITIDLSKFYTDPDGDEVVFEYQNLPDFITADGSLITFGNVTLADFQQNPNLNDIIFFNVRVSDGEAYLELSTGNLLSYSVVPDDTPEGDVLSIIGIDQPIVDTLIVPLNVVAVAHPSLAYVPGTIVALDGSGSNDPDGDNANLTYAWTQIDGPTVTLIGADIVIATFITPEGLGIGESLVFKLTVSNADGLSNSTRITITNTGTLRTDSFNAKAITVFPTSNRTLRVTGLGNEKADVQLFDVLGQLILKTTVSSGHEVNLYGGIKTGIYIVRINTLKGSLNKKIILR